MLRLLCEHDAVFVFVFAFDECASHAISCARTTTDLVTSPWRSPVIPKKWSIFDRENVTRFYRVSQYRWYERGEGDSV